MRNNKKTIFIIVQKNKITKEILVFGEIKIKVADHFEVLNKLNDKNFYHKYSVEEKKYFNNNKENILKGF